MADPHTFHLLINNPERTFFDADVVSVSSKNDSGAFDILANHSHFITLLKNTEVSIVSADNKTTVYQIVRGLLSCNDNKVRVFVDL